MRITITGNSKGRKIRRTAYSNFQAFTIINLLAREDVSNIGMREEASEHETKVSD